MEASDSWSSMTSSSSWWNDMSLFSSPNLCARWNLSLVLSCDFSAFSAVLSASVYMPR